ncbi:MAG: AarF/ABC1/UbiB kinase family protein [Verrucomicrobiales bacterium]
MFSIRKIGALARTYQHLDRYRQIVQVLFKYGFGEVIQGLGIERYIDLGLKMIAQERDERIAKATRPQRLRMAVEELGPTFVKLGQILSTRPDLVPFEYADELAKLQDNVPPFAFEKVRERAEEEFGKPLEDVFSLFEEKPLAAASIGQVHRAVLRDGGDAVVVKVQRPDIRRVIEIDLEIMLHFAGLMEKHIEELGMIRPTRVVEEFTRVLGREIDYTTEAGNIERFAAQFLTDPSIYVPKVYTTLTTPSVLVMEFIDGIKPTNIAALVKEGHDLHQLAVRGAELILKQVFVHGFFHADPHPGNIFVMRGGTIAYVDFGMMGRVSSRERETFTRALLNIVRRDDRRAVEALLRLTHFEGDPDRAKLERDLTDGLERYLYKPLSKLDLGAMLSDIMEILTRHQLSLKPELYLMVKALAAVEGLGSRLDPNFEFVKVAEPFIRGEYARRYSPLRLTRELFDTGAEAIVALRDLPNDAREVVRLLRQGKVKIQFEHHGLKELRASNEQISNRISFAIVLAALIIGSSLVIHSDIPPKWGEIPVIGLGGFIIAGFMGFWLLVSILRHGKM